MEERKWPEVSRIQLVLQESPVTASEPPPNGKIRSPILHQRSNHATLRQFESRFKVCHLQAQLWVDAEVTFRSSDDVFLTTVILSCCLGCLGAFSHLCDLLTAACRLPVLHYLQAWNSASIELTMPSNHFHLSAASSLPLESSRALDEASGLGVSHHPQSQRPAPEKCPLTHFPP